MEVLVDIMNDEMGLSCLRGYKDNPGLQQLI